jgi:hypothetical protein
MRKMSCAVVVLSLTLAGAPAGQDPASRQGDGAPTRLAVRGDRFTLNGKETFLLGASYYGALGASEATTRRDLDGLQKRGFNWVRVWCTWSAFENDVSVVDADGRPRPQLLKKLQWLVAECDGRGMIVDVTLSRGNGVTGPARLQSHEAHRRAVEAVCAALKRHANWYLDLSNERNIRDQRFTSFDELAKLREAVRRIDPARLVTASHAGDISEKDLKKYLRTVRVNFIAPHRPRNAKSPAQTAAQTREYMRHIKDLGRVVPVHYQEPFRRDFGKYQPSAADFLADLRGAKAGGAAGWCFHNGDNRPAKDGRPRRSFDLREKGLFDQLDAAELKVVNAAARTAAE